MEHAFAILRLFAAAEAPLGIADIARRIGLPLSTAHRVVMTMCDADFLQQQYEGGKYEPGIRVRELLLALYDQFPIRAAAMPVLRALAADSGQAATLTVPLGYRALRIAGIRDQQFVHRPLLIGEVGPLHAGAAPMAVLAFQSPEQLQAYLDATSLPPASRKDLERDLRRIAEDGYVLTEVSGLTTVAFPVRNPAGTAAAAVALEGATVQLKRPSEKEITRWRSIVTQLEQRCADSPGLATGPFDHIPSEEMRPDLGAGLPGIMQGLQ